jgi:hypothetical protein
VIFCLNDLALPVLMDVAIERSVDVAVQFQPQGTNLVLLSGKGVGAEPALYYDGGNVWPQPEWLRQHFSTRGIHFAKDRYIFFFFNLLL